MVGKSGFLEHLLKFVNGVFLRLNLLIRPEYSRQCDEVTLL